MSDEHNDPDDMEDAVNNFLNKDGEFMKSMRLAQEKECPCCGIEFRHHSTKQADDCYEAYYHPKDLRGRFEKFVRAGYWSEEMLAFIPLAGNGNANVHIDDISKILLEPKSSTGVSDASWSKVVKDCGIPYSSTLLPKCWFLHGPHGTGKTHAAHMLLVIFAMQDVATLEVTAFELGKRLYGYDGEDQVFIEADLLLIDDFDKCNWTEDRCMALWNLVNKRSMYASKRTIITTNLAPAKFREAVFYNAAPTVVESIMQRLHPVKALEFDGESMRGAE